MGNNVAIEWNTICTVNDINNNYNICNSICEIIVETMDEQLICIEFCHFFIADY